ncbi:cytochrome P450 [Streptomyces sp. NPDC058417]|uniref:cytochrome P450 n=1 Tax=unclassified Streptomyces TaxID=2593676 RepID=UPI00364B643A
MTSPPDRVPLHTEQFAADPHYAYTAMRTRYGPLVPVDLVPDVPATLVIGYDQARRILLDPVRFPADPRAWEQTIPAGSPVRPMMEHRPNALRSAGAAHARYRSANTAALSAVDEYALQALAEETATATIAGFAPAAEADLIPQFAYPVAFTVLSSLLGCPPEIGRRIADGMAMIFDTVRAQDGNQMLAAAVSDLIALRRAAPGDDVTSRLLAHPARLTDTEALHQIVTLYGAGIEPLVHLIINTVLTLLTDDAFSGHVHAGASVREALDEVLFRDPPLANFCMSYPPFPTDIDGYSLPAHQPVLISLAAAANDPVLGQDITGNRAHLAWGAGPHSCPARSLAYLIAETAITCLLDALPELDLAIPRKELTWRPGPFHRALNRLPVRYPVPSAD